MVEDRPEANLLASSFSPRSRSRIMLRFARPAARLIRSAEEIEHRKR